MSLSNIHGMTLAEAHQILKSIGYDPSWSSERLLAVVSPFSDFEIERIRSALKITGIAARAEADALRAERRARQLREGFEPEGDDA